MTSWHYWQLTSSPLPTHLPYFVANQMEYPIVQKDVLDLIRNQISSAFPHIPNSFSFLSGSVTEGLATPKSDYDVYLVLDDSVAESNESEIFIPSRIGLIEISTIKLRSITHIAEKLRSGFGKMGELSPYELHLAHRVVTGVALENEHFFSQVQASIDRGNLSNYLSDFSHSFAEKCYSDAVGNLAASDEDTALFNADRATHLALDHLLAVSGSTASLVKWRSRYAKKFLGTTHPAYVRYMELISSIPAHGVYRKRLYIAEVGRFMQSIWDHTLALKYFPEMNAKLDESRLYGADPMEMLQKGIVEKKSWARITNSNGKIFLTTHGPLFEITKEILVVWLMIDNKSDLVKIVMEVEKLNLDDITLSKKFARDCLEKLRNIGVISYYAEPHVEI